jgi:hypothetical protein
LCDVRSTVNLTATNRLPLEVRSNGDTKKQLEKAQLDSFIKGLEIEIDQIIPGDEPPDFVLLTKDGRRIAIEITQIIQQSLRRNEEMRNHIVEEAERLFVLKYAVEIDCMVRCFPVQLTGKARETASLISELFEAVEAVYLENRDVEFDIDLDNSFGGSSFYEKIHLAFPPVFGGWQSHGANSVNLIDQAAFLAAVVKKENRLPNYAGMYDSKWLLFVIPVGSKSSAFRFDGIQFENFESSFDSVFLHRIFTGETLKVK